MGQHTWARDITSTPSWVFSHFLLLFTGTIFNTEREFGVISVLLHISLQRKIRHRYGGKQQIKPLLNLIASYSFKMVWEDWALMGGLKETLQDGCVKRACSFLQCYNTFVLGRWVPGRGLSLHFSACFHLQQTGSICSDHARLAFGRLCSLIYIADE